MTRKKIENLLKLLVDPDKDPATVEYVVKRLMADIESAYFSYARDVLRDSSKAYDETR